MPFGTTPATEEYTTVSEAEIYLGNNLLWDEYWDIDDLNSPHQYLLPLEEKQQSKIHLETAGILAVEITVTEASMDVFINDIINFTVDENIGYISQKVRLYWSSVHYYNHYSHQNP